MLPRLDLHLYAAPNDTRVVDAISVNGCRLNMLTIDGVDQTLFSESFEWLEQRLERLDRFHFEPDGSFVFSGDYGGSRWQLDGMVYDRNNCIQRIELAGTCPLNDWKSLLALIGDGRESMVAFLRTQKCLVATAELEKLWTGQ